MSVTGTVKSYDKETGSGFLAPDYCPSNPVFVHHTELLHGLDALNEGQSVIFEIDRAHRGRRATNVALQ
jgi:cold shock CspA family protein